jgi:hypothetical protein
LQQILFFKILKVCLVLLEEDIYAKSNAIFFFLRNAIINLISFFPLLERGLSKSLILHSFQLDLECRMIYKFNIIVINLVSDF